MASFVYGAGLQKALDQSLDMTDTAAKSVRYGLSTAAHVPDQDDIFNDDTGSDDFVDGELSGTGYTAGYDATGRIDAVTPAFVYDTAANRVEFDNPDITWTAIGPGTGTAVHLTLMYEGVSSPVTTADTDSPVFAEIDIADTVPNGGDITIQFDAQGIIQFPV
jgi:hypothetical protein